MQKESTVTWLFRSYNVSWHRSCLQNKKKICRNRKCYKNVWMFYFCCFKTAIIETSRGIRKYMLNVDIIYSFVTQGLPTTSPLTPSSTTNIFMLNDIVYFELLFRKHFQLCLQDASFSVPALMSSRCIHRLNQKDALM